MIALTTRLLKAMITQASTQEKTEWQQKETVAASPASTQAGSLIDIGPKDLTLEEKDCKQRSWTNV